MKHAVCLPGSHRNHRDRMRICITRSSGARRRACRPARARSRTDQLADPSAKPQDRIASPARSISRCWAWTNGRARRSTTPMSSSSPASTRKCPAVTLLSIPRDTPAYIPGVGVRKVNTAFAFGGADLFKQTIRYNFGIEVSTTRWSTFTGVVHAVDTFGGIDVIATCPLQHAFPKDPYYMGDTSIVREPYDRHVYRRGLAGRQQSAAPRDQFAQTRRLYAGRPAVAGVCARAQRHPGRRCRSRPPRTARGARAVGKSQTDRFVYTN